MFLDSHRMVFTFLNWLNWLGVALVFRISILKIFQATDTGLQISQDTENMCKSLQVLLWPFV